MLGTVIKSNVPGEHLETNAFRLPALWRRTPDSKIPSFNSVHNIGFFGELSVTLNDIYTHFVDKKVLGCQCSYNSTSCLYTLFRIDISRHATDIQYIEHIRRKISLPTKSRIVANDFFNNFCGD